MHVDGRFMERLGVGRGGVAKCPLTQASWYNFPLFLVYPIDMPECTWGVFLAFCLTAHPCVCLCHSFCTLWGYIKHRISLRCKRISFIIVVIFVVSGLLVSLYLALVLKTRTFITWCTSMKSGWMLSYPFADSVLVLVQQAGGPDQSAEGFRGRTQSAGRG